MGINPRLITVMKPAAARSAPITDPVTAYGSLGLIKRSHGEAEKIDMIMTRIEADIDVITGVQTS